MFREKCEMYLSSGACGKFDNTFLCDSRHSGVRKIRRRPCYACIFLPCSDDCHCEKFVTELPHAPLVSRRAAGIQPPDRYDLPGLLNIPSKADMKPVVDFSVFGIDIDL